MPVMIRCSCTAQNTGTGVKSLSADAWNLARWHYGEVGDVKTRLVLQMKERRTIAPLCGPGELDRARYQKRQGDPPAYRQRRRDSREAWVDVGASVLDRRSLRHGHHL